MTNLVFGFMICVFPVFLYSQDSISWMTADARASGSGCRFDGEENAFVIANGGDLSIVFTALGSEVRKARHGRRDFSNCAFQIPFRLPENTYLADWDQRLVYGLVKPRGVAAGMNIDFDITARQRTGHGLAAFGMPPFQLRFGRDEEINLPLAVATSPHESFSEHKPLHRGWRARWCHRERPTTLIYSGRIRLWSEKNEDGLEVIFAVDGLDARFETSHRLRRCGT